MEKLFLELPLTKYQKITIGDISLITSRLNKELADKTGKTIKKLKRDTQIIFYLSVT